MEVSVSGNGGSEISILPERTLSRFTNIKFLGDTTGHKLHAAANDFTTRVTNQQVDMIGSCYVVKNGQPIPFAGLIQPVFPAQPVTVEFE
jgi:hypothetical protein